MITQFDHTLVSSFYLWFENHLIGDKMKAYNTGIANSYEYMDAYDVPAEYYAYQGGFRQLVADHSVDVPNSGVFVGGTFVTGNSSLSNVLTDYNNGRIMVPTASGKALTITSVSTVKEINTYLSNDDDEQILLHGDFIEAGSTEPYFISKPAKLDEKTYFLPACFVSLATSENKEFAFGGEEDTSVRIRVMVLANDNYTLDSVLSSFRDTVRETVVLVPYEQFPYGNCFSLKSFPYRYAALRDAQPENSATRAAITKVSSSKVTGGAAKERLNKKFLIGFLEFDLSTFRFPRI